MKKDAEKVSKEVMKEVIQEIRAEIGECEAGVSRRVEVWRPVKNLIPEQMLDALKFAEMGGREMALIDVDEKLLDWDDMLVDAGLEALCETTFKAASRPAVFNYIAIGVDGTAADHEDTALLSESMRVLGTYGKDTPVGECSLDATFDIVATLALQECGLLNAASVGTLYCRDTYTTKNVVSGDTVKVYYTGKFQRPA